MNLQLIKQLVSPLLVVLASILIAGCEMAPRDNANDPSSPDYKISATPASGNGATIIGHEDVVIRFSDSMNTSSIVIGGDIILANTNFASNPNGYVRWSKTLYDDDTLTISQINNASPKVFWPKGAVNLTVQGTTAAGETLEFTTMSFTVVYKVFVRAINSSDTANSGTRALPVATIQKGISLCTAMASGTTWDVCVAKGTYSSNYNTTSTPVINMVEGVSVYGGYSDAGESAWNLPRNFTTFETILQDSSTAGGASLTNPNRATSIPASITRSTILDGFTIKMGKGAYNAGILCLGSPIISNNNIIGWESSDTGSLSYNQIGISFSGSTGAMIQKNTIDPRYSSSTNNCSYGLYISSSSPEIFGNYSIKGGGGGYTYAIYIVNSSNPQIKNNEKIDTGFGSTEAICIRIAGSSNPAITDNILTKSAFLSICGIYEASTNDNPSTVRRNDFNYLGNWYRDAGGSMITDEVYSTSVSTLEGNENLFDPLEWNNKSTCKNIN